MSALLSPPFGRVSSRTSTDRTWLVPMSAVFTWPLMMSELPIVSAAYAVPPAITRNRASRPAHWARTSAVSRERMDEYMGPPSRWQDRGFGPAATTTLYPRLTPHESAHERRTTGVWS